MVQELDFRWHLASSFTTTEKSPTRLFADGPARTALVCFQQIRVAGEDRSDFYIGVLGQQGARRIPLVAQRGDRKAFILGGRTCGKASEFAALVMASARIFA